MSYEFSYLQKRHRLPLPPQATARSLQRVNCKSKTCKVRTFELGAHFVRRLLDLGHELVELALCLRVVSRIGQNLGVLLFDLLDILLNEVDVAAYLLHL